MIAAERAGVARTFKPEWVIVAVGNVSVVEEPAVEESVALVSCAKSGCVEEGSAMPKNKAQGQGDRIDLHEISNK